MWRVAHLAPTTPRNVNFDSPKDPNRDCGDPKKGKENTRRYLLQKNVFSPGSGSEFSSLFEIAEDKQSIAHVRKCHTGNDQEIAVNVGYQQSLSKLTHGAIIESCLAPARRAQSNPSARAFERNRDVTPINFPQ